MFGLTKASIGYHLNLLMEEGLIEIVKTELEEHGIMQKYYASKAAVFIPDFDRTPEQVRKRFIHSKKEWLRGALNAFRLYKGENKDYLQIDSDTLEELATEFLRKLTVIDRSCEKEITSNDRELILPRIYCRTLSDLIRDPKWSNRFKKSSKWESSGMKRVKHRR